MFSFHACRLRTLNYIQFCVNKLWNWLRHIQLLYFPLKNFHYLTYCHNWDTISRAFKNRLLTFVSKANCNSFFWGVECNTIWVCYHFNAMFRLQVFLTGNHKKKFHKNAHTHLHFFSWVTVNSLFYLTTKLRKSAVLFKIARI